MPNMHKSILIMFGLVVAMLLLWLASPGGRRTMAGLFQKLRNNINSSTPNIP